MCVNCESYNELFMNLTDICCLSQQLVGKLHGNAFHFWAIAVAAATDAASAL